MYISVLPHLTGLSTLHENENESGGPSNPAYFKPRHDAQVTGTIDVNNTFVPDDPVPDEHNTLIE